MKSGLLLPILAISMVSVILFGAVTAFGRLPNYPEMNLSPIRVIFSDTEGSKDGQILLCSYLRENSALPPLAPRLHGADFLTSPLQEITTGETAAAKIQPFDSLAQNSTASDFRCAS
jgi:hypothetical protein